MENIFSGTYRLAGDGMMVKILLIFIHHDNVHIQVHIIDQFMKFESI